MNLYRVVYTTFVYVKASNEKEALEQAEQLELNDFNFVTAEVEEEYGDWW